MKIGDLVCPRFSPKKQENPIRVGLVVGERFGQYNGPVMKIKWLGDDIKYPSCIWEPKKYLEVISEAR